MEGKEQELPFIASLRLAARYKVRSDETHDLSHGPLLGSLVLRDNTGLDEAGNDDQRQEHSENEKQQEKEKEKEGDKITTMLLGDSMFERFLTTGRDTEFGTMGDSMSTDTASASSQVFTQTQFPHIFNVGVGGDRVCNVAYRLVVKGLLFELQRVGCVEFIFLEMGTNDLPDGGKKAISDQVVATYTCVVQALRWACPRARICVCALNPRLKVKKTGVVEDSNLKLEQMVLRLRGGQQPMNSREGCTVADDRIVFMQSDGNLTHHLEDDGVHLNKTGYEIFAKNLTEQSRIMRGLMN